MKIQGGTITGISASPSGQIVAHVTTDHGRVFQMPFGPMTGMPVIIKAVEGEIASHMGVREIAARLHAQVVQVAPKPVTKPLRWHQKTWLALSWYFRRKK